MNKMQALVLVLAMSISGSVLAADAPAAGGSAPGGAPGWGAAVSPSVAAPVAGIVGPNAGFILFAAGVAGTVAGSANVASTTNH